MPARSPAQELLRQDILCGKLAPGQRLRTEDLQRQCGLGLSPLRESLQRLSAEGMVVNDEQRGFAVAPISVAELEDLTLARTALESIMLPMAIGKGDADWEADIVAAFHRLSRTPLPHDPAAVADARVGRAPPVLPPSAGRPLPLALAAAPAWPAGRPSERYRKIRLLHHQQSSAQSRCQRRTPGRHGSGAAPGCRCGLRPDGATSDRHHEATARLMAAPNPMERLP